MIGLFDPQRLDAFRCRQALAFLRREQAALADELAEWHRIKSPVDSAARERVWQQGLAAMHTQRKILDTTAAACVARLNALGEAVEL